MSELLPEKPDESTSFYLEQQQLYSDLLASTRQLPPVESLAKFEGMFFGHSSSTGLAVSPFVYKILFANSETEFRNTLKRACYILVNNWDRSCQSDMVHTLLSLFDQPSLKKSTASLSVTRLRQWLSNFALSQDFEELKLYATRRIGSTHPSNWSSRYATYQFTAQAMDDRNSLEQKEAARKMARRLKNKFKHELAMYTAFSQSSGRLDRKYPNPTVLGDQVLRLIKAILMRRGQSSYRNVARLFQRQMASISYRDYKENLVDYLCFAIAQPEFIIALEAALEPLLSQLYADQNETEVDPSLILRTCNRLVDLLTTEDTYQPSQLFKQLITQGSPLNIATLILKIVLISPSSQPYLEARLASLINYYRPCRKTECESIIQFLEICDVMFAIYSDSVEYSLVRIKLGQNEPEKMEDFRIFSRSSRAAQQRAKLALRQHQSEQVGAKCS